MKKGTEITGYVERIDYPNKGIIQTTEGPIKVACALPGQKIRCTVKKFRSGSGEGILREIIQRSDIETEPVCPHAARCGGCLYQGVGYEEERAPTMKAGGKSATVLCLNDQGGYNMEYSEEQTGTLLLGNYPAPEDLGTLRPYEARMFLR